MTISYNQFSYVTRLVLGIMKSKSQKAEQVSWNFKSKSLIIRFTFVSKENCNISTAILLVFDIYLVQSHSALTREEYLLATRILLTQSADKKITIYFSLLFFYINLS